MADDRDDESAYKDHKKDWEMFDEDLKVLLKSIYGIQCLEWSLCFFTEEVPPIKVLQVRFERYIYSSGEYMDDIRERVAKKMVQMFPEETDFRVRLHGVLDWFLKSMRDLNASRQKMTPPLHVLLNVGTGEEEEPNLKPATRDESEEDEPNLKTATRDEAEEEKSNLKPATRDETEEEEKEPVPKSTAKTGGDETRWTRSYRVWMKPVIVYAKSD
jgi:hypothetical protein